LRPATGYGHTLRYLRAARAAITSKQRFFPTCYGTELTSNAILKWQEERQVEWHYIAPGKPMQNGFVESFNGRLRPYRDIAAQCPAGQWTNASMSTCSTICAMPAV